MLRTMCIRKAFAVTSRNIRSPSRLTEIAQLNSAVDEMKTGLRSFRKYVPAELVRQVLASGVEANLGASDAVLTVYFSDIEGFTSISEDLPPEVLINTLNDYFEAVSRPIEAHGGVINQFQGDAILATFNLPQALSDHARKAVQAAIDIQATLAENRFGKGLSLRTRVGVNTGVVVGGLVGTHDRLGYTVHGDAVNLAARLEQLNKEHGSWIVLSAETCRQAGVERFPFRSLGSVQIRGRHQPTEIFTLPEVQAELLSPQDP